MVVLFSVTRTCLARPRWASVIDPSENEDVLLSTDPPTTAARSSSLCSRRSPNPGARTATDWNAPLTWLCTSIDSAVPSMFSAIRTSGRGSRMILSRIGISSWTLVTFSLHIRMYGSSSTASSRPGSVTR